MTNERIDVLAVMGRAHAHLDPQRESLRDDLIEACAAVAELIEADKEYDAARRDWDHVTAHDPEETSDETWRRVSDRFEVALMRRVAALARVQGGA